MKKVYSINSFTEKIMKVLITISVPVMTFLLSNCYLPKYIIIGVFFAFFITLYLVLRKIKISKIKLSTFLISTFISCSFQALLVYI